MNCANRGTRRPAAIALTALLVSSCGWFRWQPYFEPDNNPGGGVLPTVSFLTLGGCQEYLHLRFANLQTAGTMYCMKNCRRRSADSTVDVPTRIIVTIGDLQCPLADRQIVGQILGIE